MPSQWQESSSVYDPPPHPLPSNLRGLRNRVHDHGELSQPQQGGKLFEGNDLDAVIIFQVA
jgi:hypothetical protein